MLKIWLGPFRKNCIINPSGYFDDHKKPEWFNDPWVKEVIKKIDHVDAIKDEYMVSPILGVMTPMHLSSGCKSLILLRQNPMCNVYATRCWDNCAKYILDLAEDRDVMVTLHHTMLFPRDFNGVVLDTGEEFHDRMGYLMAVLNWKEYAREHDIDRGERLNY